MEKREKAESRMDDARWIEMRTQELHATMHMLPVDPLHIPQEYIPNGIEYCWFRHFIKGAEPDYYRESQARGMGYTPVTPERNPRLAKRFLVDGENQLKNCIEHRGLVLYEIPKVFVDARRKKMAEEEYNRITSMDSLKNALAGAGVPSMPGVVFGNQTTTSLSFGG